MYVLLKVKCGKKISVRHELTIHFKYVYVLLPSIDLFPFSFPSITLLFSSKSLFLFYFLPPPLIFASSSLS